MSPRTRGAVLTAAGLALAGLAIAAISHLDGLPRDVPIEGSRGPWSRSYRSFPDRQPTIAWMLVAAPVFLSVVGLLQLIFGKPLRDLPRAWDSLGEGVQRVIVYGLLVAIPALMIWLAARFS